MKWTITLWIVLALTATGLEAQFSPGGTPPGGGAADFSDLTGTATDAQIPDTISLNGSDAKNLEDSPTALGNLGATETITLLNDDTFTGTLDANTEITFSTTGLDTGAHYMKKLRLAQDGTGGRVPTFAGLTLSETPVVNPRANAQFDIILDISHNGSAWVAVAYFDKPLSVQCTIVAPNDLADATRDACLVWQNDTGRTMYVTSWEFLSAADDTDLNIEKTGSTGASNVTVDAVSIASNGTGLYYAADSTITAGALSAGDLVFLDFDDTDTPGWVKGRLTLWP